MIQVNNLNKAFNNKPAVKDLSFKISAGEIFGLLGPNGAGKTTTIRILATILQPDSGSAMINGHDVQKNPLEVRRSIGVLTTDIGHYDRFSASENLAFFGQLYGLGKQQLKNRIEELANLLDMTDFLDKKAGQCSTGMRQKIALARSIIHDPPIFILDEPTTGLDVLASQTVLQFIEQARKQEKTIILSTHNMSTAQNLCQRVLIMHEGQEIFSGTPDLALRQTRQDLLENAFMQLIEN